MARVRFRLGELSFSWDLKKYEQNVRKHGVSFEEAASVWFDAGAIERFDREHSQQEDRWIRIGSSLRGAVLVVWSSDRTSDGRIVVRIIGARKASKKERAVYEKANTKQRSS